MEKSWNMKIWQKVTEFCSQSRNFNSSAAKFTKCVRLLLTLRKLALIQEVYIFQPFPQNVSKYEIWAERGTWKIEKWPWKCHWKIIEKLFAKSLGTLQKEVHEYMPSLGQVRTKPNSNLCMHLTGVQGKSLFSKTAYVNFQIYFLVLLLKTDYLMIYINI